MLFEYKDNKPVMNLYQYNTMNLLGKHKTIYLLNFSAKLR